MILKPVRWERFRWVSPSKTGLHRVGIGFTGFERVYHCSVWLRSQSLERERGLGCRGHRGLQVFSFRVSNGSHRSAMLHSSGIRGIRAIPDAEIDPSVSIQRVHRHATFHFPFSLIPSITYLRSNRTRWNYEASGQRWWVSPVFTSITRFFLATARFNNVLLGLIGFTELNWVFTFFLVFPSFFLLDFTEFFLRGCWLRYCFRWLREIPLKSVECGGGKKVTPPGPFYWQLGFICLFFFSKFIFVATEFHRISIGWT